MTLQLKDYALHSSEADYMNTQALTHQYMPLLCPQALMVHILILISRMGIIIFTKSLKKLTNNY